MKHWYGMLTAWACSAAMALGAATTARLALSADTVKPGDTVLAGIVLEMAPGWHTYWRNPGESGMATEIKWELPAGVTAGAIQWPVPESYEAGGLTTYVLHERTILVVPLIFGPDVPSGPVMLRAEVSWLECEELCIPGDATVERTITVADATRPSTDASLLESAKAKLPAINPEFRARAAWDGPPEGDERALIIEWPAQEGVDRAEFFPYAAQGFEVRPQMERLPVDRSRVALRTVVTKYEGNWPTEISGIVVQTRAEARQATEVHLQVADMDEASLAPTESIPSPATSPAGSGGNLVLYLLLALGGGLILNLMPCVLPILSLKILSLVRQGGSTSAERRKHGLVYTFGVLVSFWVIGGLVIAGRLASWGAQFQDGRFIVVVTVLMTVVALNLFGVFEVILPGSTVTSANHLASREGAAGSFFNGVLAVILGASCVAPLLAAAIGWAISKPPAVIFLTFSLIGFGLALPFLLLSFFPVLQAWLPKPGPWMEKFKVAMGFPMLATAAWLLSQTADHYGSAGPLWVGIFLVLLALALWIYGEFIQRGGKRKGLAILVAFIFGVGGYAVALERELDWRVPPETVPGQAAPGFVQGEEGIPWQPWSGEAVEKARQAGRPILVDFTANWCLTCKLNKKTSLEIDEVRHKLSEINAVALLGDYTRKNPAITEELRRFDRAGVPLVLVYPRDPSKPPVVLPTVLTPSIVVDALEAAAR